jgi:hypothetical protein
MWAGMPRFDGIAQEAHLFVRASFSCRNLV